jgi:hypothetical protein
MLLLEIGLHSQGKNGESKNKTNTSAITHLQNSTCYFLHAKKDKPNIFNSCSEE